MPNATEPNQTPRRRWLRFSLRGALIVMTIAAVGLGWQVRQARQQKQALERIKHFGGQVRFDWQYDHTGEFLGDHPNLEPTPPGSGWLRERIGHEYFQQVCEVRLVEPYVPANQQPEQMLTNLQPLAGLPHVTYVSIKRQQFDESPPTR